jgi:hypothetical protein
MDLKPVFFNQVGLECVLHDTGLQSITGIDIFFYTFHTKIIKKSLNLLFIFSYELINLLSDALVFIVNIFMYKNIPLNFLRD